MDKISLPLFMKLLKIMIILLTTYSLNSKEKVTEVTYVEMWLGFY